MLSVQQRFQKRNQIALAAGLLFGVDCHAQVVDPGTLSHFYELPAVKSQFLDNRQRAFELVDKAYQLAGASAFESLDSLYLVIDHRIYDSARTDTVAWASSPIREWVFNAWDFGTRKFRGLSRWELSGGLAFLSDTLIVGSKARTEYWTGSEVTSYEVHSDSFHGVDAHPYHGWLAVLPARTLMLARRQPFGLTHLGATSLAGRRVEVVEFTWPASPKRPRIFLAPDTGEVVAMNSDFYDPISGDFANLVVFEGHQVRDGIPAPERILVHVNDKHILDRRIVDFGRLPPPQRERVFDPDSVSNEATDTWRSVSPGARIHGFENVSGYEPFNLYFAEFDEFIAVFDAPHNTAVTEEFVDRIDRRFGKPVRYVVLSHSHAEHLAGLKTFLARGVTIIAPTAADDLITRAATGSPSVFGGNAHGTKHPPHEKILLAPGERYTIAQAGRSVVVSNIGASPHTSENLVVVSGDDKVIIQGDLYTDAAKQSQTHRFFDSWVRTNGLTDYTVVGAHHAPIAGSKLADTARRPVPTPDHYLHSFGLKPPSSHEENEQDPNH